MVYQQQKSETEKGYDNWKKLQQKLGRNADERDWENQKEGFMKIYTGDVYSLDTEEVTRVLKGDKQLANLIAERARKLRNEEIQEMREENERTGGQSIGIIPTIFICLAAIGTFMIIGGGILNFLFG